MTYKSYAKVNLALSVLNKNKPEKMHNLDMINVSVSLCDFISCKFLKEGNEITIICDNPLVPHDETNLVSKVIRKFQKIFKLTFSSIITIKKNIPLEAGLGGGSSNAATILNVLDKTFKSKMSYLQKIRFIEDITSDGSYMVLGGLARIKGTGNEVYPINKKLNYKVALIKPKYGFNTAKTYGSIDYQSITRPNINKLEDALIDNDLNYFASHTANSLYDVCKTLNPEIEGLVNRLKSLGFELVSMSGSGSCIYAISNNKEPYKRLLKEFKKEEFDLVGIYKII